MLPIEDLLDLTVPEDCMYCYKLGKGLDISNFTPALHKFLRETVKATMEKRNNFNHIQLWSLCGEGSPN